MQFLLTVRSTHTESIDNGDSHAVSKTVGSSHAITIESGE